MDILYPIFLKNNQNNLIKLHQSLIVFDLSIKSKSPKITKSQNISTPLPLLY